MIQQPVLMLGYQGQLHKCSLQEQEEKTITVGNSKFDTITFATLQNDLQIEWDGQKCQVNDQVLVMNETLQVSLPESSLFMYLTDVTSRDPISLDISGELTVTIGIGSHSVISIDDLTADLILTRKTTSSTFQLHVNEGMVYHNFKQVSNFASVNFGDHLFFDGISIVVGQQDLQLNASVEKIQTHLVAHHIANNVYDEDYPDYHRSPRIIYREPKEKKVIASPSSKPSKPSEQLMRTIIPPIVMIAGLSIVSIFQPRGIYIIVMLSVTVTIIILSIVSYVKSSKQYRIDMKDRTESYQEYLLNKTKELYETKNEQHHALTYHYPNIEEIKEMTLRVNARIYEKTMFHHDFLTYRVGLGKKDASFEIDFSEEEFTQDKDELMKEARELYDEYREIDQVPISTSLVEGPVGYIGQRSLVLEQLQLMIMQTAFFQSYHDLQFIVVFPEEEYDDWAWMRWLPHASIKELNVRGFIYNDRSRDQILTSLYQILNERKHVYEDKADTNEKTYFSPHYVILITDEKLVLDHTIMEFFDEDLSDLGVSLVFVQDVLESLPEHVSTVIDIRDINTGNVLLEKSELVNQSFTPDHFPNEFKKELISRSLAPLNHLQSLKSTIPEMVTFLEMYGVERIEDINLKNNWRKNETYKSLAVPIGLRGKDDLVYLNLHEKAHGPHGLLAGTTGSGKSEIIQSYILSLAVNFHPHEVAFLLIDYKGGGMANLFKDLPHLVGAITNLDGAASMRALASIKAELQKRQRMFGENDVNHINQYQKLVQEGKADEPMPHLFLISDEFAELKAEQPEFMKELVSTARIGRSLGIHLILATQKPSGVVDDQIWSNSKFKIALKVQDASDSNEILKTPDAAEITLPGRAYLQVGNNEIYELFQSAWSGADYRSDKDDLELVDTTIYSINDLGQYDIITKDLSGLGQKDAIEKTQTELEAVIHYVNDFTIQENIDALPSPWLPPLAARIMLSEIIEKNYQEQWQEPKQILYPIIGVGDFPEEQDQRPIHIPITKDGHLAVFSSPGYGKSSFIQTVIMDLVRTHSPSDLHIYLLDFGTNGLLPLRDLPHVADMMLIDEEEKIKKLLRRLEQEINHRKQLLRQVGVATMEIYEKATGETNPHMLISIDNYDAIRESEYVEEFERTIIQLAREGASIGIHLMITASRQNVLRMPLLSNIKTQIALYLIEEFEARNIVGKTDHKTEEMPGRGLIKLEEPTVFQTALPTNGADTLAVIEAIQSEAKEMDAHWDGERPEAIPMMPEEVIDFNEFKENKKIRAILDEGALPLGLDYEHVEPLAFNFNHYGNLIAVGDRFDKIEKMRNMLVQSMLLLNESHKTMLVDSGNRTLESFSNKVDTYVSDLAVFSSLKAELLSDIDYRIRKQTNEPKWTIMINDFKEFVVQSSMDKDEMNMLWNASRLGINFIICSDASYLGQSFEQIPKFVREQAVAGLLGIQLGDQDIFKQRFISNEPSLQADEYYFAMDHQYTKIKIPQ